MSVEVSEVEKHFGPRAEVAAVNRVSFSAPSGRLTALLGPSGSGKSTLLRLIAGLETPDAGKVAIDGDDVTRTLARDRGIGFVFQNYALFGHMTVAENIGFGLSVRKRPRSEIDARVNQLLALVQLEGYGKRHPAELSGGQRQRVALARAMAMSPRVLLLDEPFGALDARVRAELREWVLALHQQTRVTTLLVTHDQEEAFELAEHVVLLHEGKVAQAGTPHELYDRPANPFVASFLGGANVLGGRIHEGRAEVGASSLASPPGLPDGSSIQAFVRPHDVRVRRLDAARDVAVGRVERLVRIGGYVKLMLELPGGDSLSVQMSKSEIETLGLQPGDRVAIDLVDAKLFVADYSI
jgi:sulfate transport system ATP-binding protein